MISSSPTGAQPVFDAMAESAARWHLDADRFLLVADHGPIMIGPVGELSLLLVHGMAVGRTVMDGSTVHAATCRRSSRRSKRSWTSIAGAVR